jgi:hypothetical protein
MSGMRCGKPASWAILCPNFDADYARNGPVGFAHQLGFTIDEVFPIQYDISKSAVGLASIIRATIAAEPVQRLSEEERMALIFDET